METPPRDLPTVPDPGSPEAVLDAFNTHPEWDEARCDEELERLVLRSTPDQLRAALRTRLYDLGARVGEPVLRLLEALATPELLALLAEALRAQPGLAPERAWAALALLGDAGLLDHNPELAERWEELNETFEEDGSLAQLAAQIEDEPEGLWLALQGLAAVEPEIRAEIIAGLVHAEPAGQPGTNLIEFLRLLSFAHDPATRAAALGALESVTASLDDRRLAAAWAGIAAEHPDPEVARQARNRLEHGVSARSLTPLVVRPVSQPQLVRSLVAAVNGSGQAPIVLSVSDGTTRTTAAFLCDVQAGIAGVFGHAAPEAPVGDAFLEEIADVAGHPRVLDAPGLAEGLLKGCLLLCGPETTPALRYWLEATLGPTIAPAPFPIPFPDWDPRTLTPDEMASRTERVLQACPDWIDDSELTHDIAEEILLRDGDSSPDPRRDRGAYRYLFEHHLRGQLELYRRMLLWMASFWQATADSDLGRSALALAVQLSDEQHAVAGHPFTVALTTRSLVAAMATLRAGRDPRARRKETSR
jgi:hypothetical protein